MRTRDEVWGPLFKRAILWVVFLSIGNALAHLLGVGMPWFLIPLVAVAITLLMAMVV
nr:hypothetical protein [Brevundimonas subvibrioides]